MFVEDPRDSQAPLLGAHAVAASIADNNSAASRFGSGAGGGGDHPLKDCIIPTIELQKIPNQQNVAEGAMGYVEKYMYR
jgi:hypothetical protein